MDRTLAAALHVLVLLSGLAGLGCELVWTRWLVGSLGHEMPATLAVVSAFFVGLTLGGWALDPRIRRSRHPVRWYAALEGVIALWCLALPVTIPAAGPWIAALVGVQPHPLWQWAVSFGLPPLLLLPATVAMGATLPAAERLMVAAVASRPWVGGL